MKTEHELLMDANQIIRSAHSIAERKGADTNWEYFEKRVKEILKEQHKFLYPTLKEIRKEKLMKINEENSIY